MIGIWTMCLRSRAMSHREQSDGRLIGLDEARRPDGILARLIRRLDAHLRRRHNIFEFSDHAGCLLRICVIRARVAFRFSDGTRINVGDPLGELHLWNEHLPLIPRGGPDLTWAIQLRRMIAESLKQLASAALHDPRLAQVKAFGATAMFASRKGDSQVARLAERYGFDWVTLERPPTFGKRFHDFWENFLLLGLQWVYNPGGLRGKPFLRPREPLWISRQVLLEQHGPVAQPSPVAGESAKSLEAAVSQS